MDGWTIEFDASTFALIRPKRQARTTIMRRSALETLCETSIKY